MNDKINSDNLFDELQLIKEFVEPKLKSWTDNKISANDRWVEIFNVLLMREQLKPRIARRIWNVPARYLNGTRKSFFTY